VYVIRKKEEVKAKKEEEKEREERETERTVFTSLKSANSRSGISFFPSYCVFFLYEL
jgi:hypothetical protein